MKISTSLLAFLLFLSFSVHAQQPPAAMGRHAIYTPHPAYPYEARRRHIEGNGIYAIHFSPDGSATSVDIIKSTGSPILDQAAISAYRRWRFQAKPGGRIIRVPLRFTMSSYRGR